jgi:tetratricopeptide (TPR) repeat protein
MAVSHGPGYIAQLMSPFDAERRFRAAAAAHRAGDLTEAEAGYREVLAAEPGVRPALQNLALILRQQDRAEDLVPIFRAWVEIEPTPELHWRLAAALLSLGRYAEAWPHFERRPRKIPPATTVPEWCGEPLAGKSLLVWHDEGFGDQIMMARLLPRLAAAAEGVTWALMPPLLRLFDQLCPTVSRLGEVPGRYDYWVPAMSLPARLGLTLQTLPSAPYLAAGQAASAGARIGVIGSCDPRQGTPRDLPQDQLARLLALPGALSLEPADTGARDFQETAAIVAGLDLVITVDTAMAHLAGALGKPVWVVLPKPADWRWLRDPRHTPWYPTARLFRQDAPGDWAAPIDRLLEAWHRTRRRV